ncbi:MAG: DUF4159 domain-containing protein [Rhodobacterales bacterium]|nr:DUF4159 domain-containing protein [Rhodobacterales bacterium]
MWMLGPIGFVLPSLLLGLIVLPILWLILRAVPPAPIRRRFPGVALLLGLKDDEAQSDRTPWWLLLLRMLVVSAVIVGFAGPILNPETERTGIGPLLIVADGTWADARDWPTRLDRIAALLDEAGRAGRTTAVLTLTNLPPDTLDFQSAEATALRLPSLQPAAWEPDPAALTTWAETLDGDFDTFWLSDGLARDSRDPLLAALQSHGQVTVFQSPRQTTALRPARFADGTITISAVRTPTGPEGEATVAAIGLDPGGVERQLATTTLNFAPGEGVAEGTLDLPAELRNRVTRFELSGTRSAGAISLTDDALRRREIALIAGSNEREGLELLSPLHYLTQALSLNSDLIDGTIPDILLANPDVIIMADVATLAQGDSAAMRTWVESGGLLIRFAGPRLASLDPTNTDADPLLPVRLRAGGRSVGGAMSWGEPKALAPFADGSPFFGLAVPADVTVSEQVMAQPDPTLAERVIAQLSDGTPLVTRSSLGDGQIVLFHVTANAEWSTLPLSGLFVQMLERLSVSTRRVGTLAEELAGTTWVPEQVLDAFGTLTDTDTLPGVSGERFATGIPAADLQPGLYAGEDRRIAVNVIGPETVLGPAAWPSGILVEGMNVTRETLLKGWLLTAALLMLVVDILASLALSGRLRGGRGNVAVLLLLGLLAVPQGGQAQETASTADTDAFAMQATDNVVLAHVITGDAPVDQVAQAGLLGLSNTLFQRTSIEPAAPMAVNIETDELAFFPFLYWPITESQPIPSRAAYEKLNRYLRTGGMILFDTRDADMGGFGSSTPEGRKLQAIARLLDIPPLEQIPSDHVLTRTFYLLQEFPGRYAGLDLWVESSSPDAEQVEGMPFRNLNDGVTPVVIGGNDWAAAWAVDEYGAPLYPVGRGMAGERQREMALRFGVNLIMHVLTGNYKSDQVHVPALLDRLGQ